MFIVRLRMCAEGMVHACVLEQVYKATWRVQTVAVKMLTHTTEKQMEAFRR